MTTNGNPRTGYDNRQAARKRGLASMSEQQWQAYCLSRETLRRVRHLSRLHATGMHAIPQRTTDAAGAAEHGHG